MKLINEKGKKMSIGSGIYTPTGKASEYARLACNIYKGCTHCCDYCYCPNCTFTHRAVFYSDPNPKKDIINKIDNDAAKLSQLEDVPEILLSFIGDPYQHAEMELGFTRAAISTLIKYDLKFTVLTKGGSRSARDFDLLSKYSGSSFGTSLVFTNQKDATKWEPGAASIKDRVDTIKLAHSMGIKTWLSIEPVIYPDQAIELVESLHSVVNHFKIGKINHNKRLETRVDWLKFRKDIKITLNKYNTDFYLKKSLSEL